MKELEQLLKETRETAALCEPLKDEQGKLNMNTDTKKKTYAIYRLEFVDQNEGYKGESRGFEYTGSKADADKRARDSGRAGQTVTCEKIEIGKGKRGLLDALNKYGAHLDNG